MANIDLSGDPETTFGKPLSLGSNSITANDYLYTSGPYIGELYVVDTTATDGQALTTTAWVKINQWQTAGAASNVTGSTINSNLTVASSGWYNVLASLSVETTVAGTYELQVYLDDTAQSNLKKSCYIGAAAQDVNCTISGYLQLSATSAVDVRAISTTAAGSILVTNGNLSVRKVG